MTNFTFAMYFNAVAAFMAALLQLRYPNQNPFLTIPTTMVVIALSTVLYYFFKIGILIFPRSRFSAIAKHLTLFFAYAAVSSLAAALFPARRAATSIYTVFILLVAGHALFVLGVFAVEDEEDHVINELNEVQTWYEGFTTSFRRYKNKLARGVAGFFQEQTTQPPEPRLPR